MLPRTDLTDQFSTFLQFAGDRPQGWSVDRRLRRSMETRRAQLQAMPFPERPSGNSVKISSEHFWAVYWHQRWLENSCQPASSDRAPPAHSTEHFLAQSHLTAYLQEPCYWAAQSLMRRVLRSEGLLGDCFQGAIAQVSKVLRACAPGHPVGLKTYSRVAFENIIRDQLRQQQGIDLCNDWALLLKVSRKQVHDALIQAGLSPALQAQYCHAHQIYQSEIRCRRVTAKRSPIQRPDAATWADLVQNYTQRYHPEPAIDAATLEQWLLDCAAQVRAYRAPRVTSLNAPRLEEGRDLQADLPATDASPLTALMQAEAEAARQDWRSQLQAVLTEALTQLDPQMQQLFQGYYQHHRTQQQMAEQMGLPQYTISRRLSKARAHLLLTLVQWSQTHLHIEPTSIVVKPISALLEEWLQEYYALARSDLSADNPPIQT